VILHVFVVRTALYGGYVHRNDRIHKTLNRYPGTRFITRSGTRVKTYPEIRALIADSSRRRSLLIAGDGRRSIYDN